MSADSKKEKIIKAARYLFVDNGFNGTSIRDIAKKAEVPISLIYHHYKNKLDLWVEVKESFLGNKDAEIADKIEGLDNFEKVLDTFIQYRLEFCANNPEGEKIFNWQRLELKNESREALVSSTTVKLWNVLKAKLEQFQRAGEIRQDYTPDYLIAMMFGGILAPFFGLGGFSLKSEEVNEYKSLLVSTFIRGLKNN
jgi:AcrR family transcriptional regulator